MTHDELLALIKRKDDGCRGVGALLSVVELHSPMSHREPYCNECIGVWQGEIDVVLYPCPTIRLIEKELA
jgi:hypothetical protein